MRDSHQRLRKSSGYLPHNSCMTRRSSLSFMAMQYRSLSLEILCKCFPLLRSVLPAASPLFLSNLSWSIFFTCLCDRRISTGARPCAAANPQSQHFTSKMPPLRSQRRPSIMSPRYYRYGPTIFLMQIPRQPCLVETPRFCFTCRLYPDPGHKRALKQAQNGLETSAFSIIDGELLYRFVSSMLVVGIPVSVRGFQNRAVILGCIVIGSLSGDLYLDVHDCSTGDWPDAYETSLYAPWLQHHSTFIN